MPNYNVYEQRWPIKAGYKDSRGNQVFEANLVLLGQIHASKEENIARAKERFRVRYPVLHELDSRGDEIRP